MTLGELKDSLVETAKCNKKTTIALIAGAVIGINSMNAEENINLDAHLNFSQQLTNVEQNCYDIQSQNAYRGFQAGDSVNENGIDVKAARKCGISLK